MITPPQETSAQVKAFSASRKRDIDRFDNAWSQNLYKGFTPEGAEDTPMLKQFLEKLERLAEKTGKRVSVMEGGAGNARQAIAIARKEFVERVYAVETSPSAQKIAEENIKASFVADKIELHGNDMVAFVDSLEPDEIQAAYFNSVFHFLPPGDRFTLMSMLYTKMETCGALALSYKAHGDGLMFDLKAKKTKEDAAGDVYRGGDGIQRLFVNDSRPIEAGLVASGFKPVSSDIEWQIPGYNYEDHPGKFIGWVAKKEERMPVRRLKSFK